MDSNEGHISLHVDCEARREVELQRRGGNSERQIPVVLPKPKIQKVHFMLGSKDSLTKFFVPKVVSFGPIHHGKKDEYKIAEAYKKAWINEFLNSTGQREEDLLIRIKENMPQLRSCFTDDVLNDDKNYDDEELARMLLLDGCAVLHYIFCYKGKYEELNIKPNIFVCVAHDMFLLENQLPFQLLDLLISESMQGKEAWKKWIKRFILKLPIAWQEREDHTKLSIDADEEEKKPTHLLELLRESLILRSGKRDPKGKKIARGAATFRSAVELKESGICFKAKTSRYLNDIAFEQQKWGFRANLEIPPVMVDDTTGPIFRNLIAYEMCPDFHNDSEVTAYICFLDTLIDAPNDVEELRKADIIRNFLGSDGELSQVFNEIATDLVTDNQIYLERMKDIERHYKNNKKTELAKFWSTHFKHPWSTTAFFAAVIGFSITVVQFFCLFYQCNNA